MHTGILDQLNITRESHVALQLSVRGDDELTAIVCGMGHPRFENMTMAEMKKDDTFNFYYNKGRSYLMESAISMIRALNE